jgi:hypothetical protein
MARDLHAVDEVHGHHPVPDAESNKAHFMLELSSLQPFV